MKKITMFIMASCPYCKAALDKLFEIIRALGIDANLIYYPENPASEDNSVGRLARLLSQCNERELKIITPLVETYLSERE